MPASSLLPAPEGIADEPRITGDVFGRGNLSLFKLRIDRGNGFKLSGSGTQGAVLPVELVWTPKLNGLPGEYRAGYYYSSAKASDVYKDQNGQPAALSGEAYRSASSKHGVWFGAQQQVTSLASDHSRAERAFVIVSRVPNVFEATMKSVSSGERSRVASTRSVESTFETKRNVMSRLLYARSAS